MPCRGFRQGENRRKRPYFHRAVEMKQPYNYDRAPLFRLWRPFPAFKECSVRFSCFAHKPPEGPDEGIEHLSWNGQSIAFTIRRGSARRKRTLIRVTRAGKVEVVLPPRLPRRAAFTAIQSRGGWILDRLREIQSYPQPVPLHYTDGEEHLFLGAYCRLQLVICGAGKKFLPSDEKVGESVVTGRSQLIHLRVDSDDPETVHKQLLLWYKAQIQKHIAYRLAELCPRIPWLATVPTWRVRTMRRRWGSCTGSGVITLNTHLIKAPPQCFDYVLLHEIAHLQEHNHSQRYYAVLERLLPNWKAVQRELEAWSPLVLN